MLYGCETGPFSLLFFWSAVGRLHECKQNFGAIELLHKAFLQRSAHRLMAEGVFSGAQIADDYSYIYLLLPQSTLNKTIDQLPYLFSFPFAQQADFVEARRDLLYKKQKTRTKEYLPHWLLRQHFSEQKDLSDEHVTKMTWQQCQNMWRTLFNIKHLTSVFVNGDGIETIPPKLTSIVDDIVTDLRQSPEVAPTVNLVKSFPQQPVNPLMLRGDNEMLSLGWRFAKPNISGAVVADLWANCLNLRRGRLLNAYNFYFGDTLYCSLTSRTIVKELPFSWNNLLQEVRQIVTLSNIPEKVFSRSRHYTIRNFYEHSEGIVGRVFNQCLLRHRGFNEPLLLENYYAQRVRTCHKENVAHFSKPFFDVKPDI